MKTGLSVTNEHNTCTSSALPPDPQTQSHFILLYFILLNFCTLPVMPVSEQLTMNLKIKNNNLIIQFTQMLRNNHGTHFSGDTEAAI